MAPRAELWHWHWDWASGASGRNLSSPPTSHAPRTLSRASERAPSRAAASKSPYRRPRWRLSTTRRTRAPAPPRLRPRACARACASCILAGPAPRAPRSWRVRMCIYTHDCAPLATVAGTRRLACSPSCSLCARRGAASLSVPAAARACAERACNAVRACVRTRGVGRGGALAFVRTDGVRASSARPQLPDAQTLCCSDPSWVSPLIEKGAKVGLASIGLATHVVSPRRACLQSDGPSITATGSSRTTMLQMCTLRRGLCVTGRPEGDGPL